MPAPTQPTPNLQLPTSFVSHPLAAAGARHLDDLPSLASSSVRRSQASVGAAYKLSGDGRSVRRLKGVLPITVQGQSVTLINPLTQTPVQSFTLSPSDQPCTAPLVVLRSRPGSKALRTTYFGVKAKDASASDGSPLTMTEVWAFTEELSTKGKGTADGAIRKEVATVRGCVSLLHTLCSGRLVATLADGGLAVLNHEVSLAGEPARTSSAPAFRVAQTIEAADNEATIHLHVALLDPTSAQPLVASTSRIEEGTLEGLRIAVSSGASAAASPKGSASNSSKKKNKKGRKSAIEVVDEAEGRQSSSGPVPVGEIAIDVTALLRPIDEAADARLRTVSLGGLSLGEVGDARTLLDLQMYGDGRLVALTRSGELISARMSLATGRPTLSQWRRIRVANLSQSAGNTLPAAILPLSRDHVLLVAAPKSGASGKAKKERVVALLFDLELDAVLSQVDWVMPPGSQSQLGVAPSISLSRVAGSMAIVQLDPPRSATPPAGQDLSQARINLLALPFVVPDHSVLRHAMGKGELTMLWTHGGPDAGASASASSHASLIASSPSKYGALADRQRELIETLESIAASTGKAKAPQMEAAFELWISEEGAKLTKARAMDDSSSIAEHDDLDDHAVSSIAAKADPVAAKARRNGKTNALKATEMSLPYNFVSALLPIVLPSTTHDSAPYPDKIIRHLLTQRAVASLMISGDGGSLLDRLRAHSDWTNIMLAVRNVSDLSEADLVLLLVEVLRSDKKRLATGAAGGNVTHSNGDKAQRTPGLAGFLYHFVAIPVSRPLLRGALKARINDVDDVAVMLQVLKAWLDAAARLPLEDGAVSQHDSVPPIDLVLPFVTDLLDTYFPLLISTPATHSLLRSMSKTIQLHLSGLNSLVTLGAPLGAFAKLEEEKRYETQRLAAASRAGGANVGPGGAAASAGNAKVPAGGKGAVAARAETGGGLGIGLGTEVGHKTRRAEAREESMLVGAYSLERLEI